TGRPERRLDHLPDPDHIGVTPSRLPHIKPKLRVAVDDRVKLGALLFFDKRRPDICFLSPAAGVIEKIDFGPRRVIRSIVIRRDKEEEKESFDVVSPERLEAITRAELVSHLTRGGLWPLLRSLPFRDLADPETTPPAIIVTLSNLDPFHPPASFYLENNHREFEFGLAALEKLGPRVFTVAAGDQDGLPPELESRLTHRLSGNYPADDPGVFTYYTRATADDNRAWYIDGGAVALLGRFLAEGHYPVNRVVAVSAPDRKQFLVTRQGVPVSQLVPGLEEGSRRWSFLAGGLWRGSPVGADDYLGFYDTALTVLPAGDQSEFLGFARPGWNKPSHSRTFLSFLNRGPFSPDTGRHGEERACVNCGSCAEVCPVDLLPQFTLKCVLAGEVEEALAHGLLDCVECGLCAYVCPSKIELRHLLRQAKVDYYNEDR
ncbi:MAG: 4Fe-4S binding protein, partial [Desulfosudaceae bacterium]